MNTSGPSASGLDPRSLSFHQVVSFSSDPALPAELARSTAFRAVEGVPAAEWIGEDPGSGLFARGRVAWSGETIVLEAFSEEWLRELEEQLGELGRGRIARDETRSFRWEDLLARPGAPFRPGEEPRNESRARHELAALFLRLAWPFLPESGLGGRLPARVAVTGPGRAEVESLLPGLTDGLRERWPAFPELEADELAEILFPPVRAKEIAPDPASTDPRRV
jgi:hypothetical protein